MSPLSRNVLVGIFVLLGTGIILWMAKNFRGGPQLAFLRDGYLLRIEFENLGGVSEGAEIRLAGKRIGMVLRTDVDLNQTRPGIVTAEVQSAYRIPLGAHAELTGELFGRKHIELRWEKTPRSDADYLQPDPAAPVVIEGRSPPGAMDQVTKSVAALEVDMRRALGEATAVLASMNKLVDKNSAAVEKSISGISAMLGSKENQESLARALAFFGNEQLHKDIGETVAGVRAVAADPKVQENIRTAVADIRAIAADVKAVGEQLRKTSVTLDAAIADGQKRIEEIGGSAKRIGDNVEAATKDLPARVSELNARINADLEKVSGVLASLQVVARRLEAGEGTAGKLLADPKLYEGMVDLVKNLQLVSEDMRKMVKKWDEGGIKFRF